jgi:hypothetical protein
MKKLRPFLLPLCAIPLIWLLLRDSRDTAGKGDSAASAPPAEAQSTTLAGNSERPAPPVATDSPITSPLPHTTAELNALADGPLPVPDKMRLLAALMRSGTPEQAKAAAMRAVFIVKNADFVAQLQPLVVQGGLKPEAMDVLALNLYDRPLNLLLPVWGQILENPGHPLASAAADGLEFHLKEKASARGAVLAQAIKDCLNGARN